MPCNVDNSPVLFNISNSLNTCRLSPSFQDDFCSTIEEATYFLVGHVKKNCVIMKLNYPTECQQ